MIPSFSSFKLWSHLHMTLAVGVMSLAVGVMTLAVGVMLNTNTNYHVQLECNVDKMEYLLPLCWALLVIVYFGADCFSLGLYSPGPGVSFIPKENINSGFT